MIRGNAVSMTGHVVKGELNKISFEEVKMSTSEVEISGHFGLAISFMEKKNLKLVTIKFQLNL